jgi:hypothetical protein
MGALQRGHNRCAPRAWRPRLPPTRRSAPRKCGGIHAHWVNRDGCFTSQQAAELHLRLLEDWFMKKSLLVLLCAGLLSEIALPPLVAQSSTKHSSTRYSRSSRRSRRGRRARNTAIGAAGGAAAGAILGRGRGAGAGAVIGGTAGALTPTRRRR